MLLPLGGARSGHVGCVALPFAGSGTLFGVVRIPVGHRRTGLCPTFAHPTLQRDGFLLRVPLVGGHLLVHQVECLAQVAGRYGNGTVELTNRGNVQLRGLVQDTLGSALDACQAAGLGDAAASLVTISPFAGPAETALRETLVRALAEIDTAQLSRKFAIHIDDVAGHTADRPADLLVQLTASGQSATSTGECQLTVRALGATTCASAEHVAVLARRLAQRCMQHGPHARPADLVASEGAPALAAALGATQPWLPTPPARAAQPLQVGVTVLAASNGEHLAVTAARFGRVSADTLAGVGALLRRQNVPWLRVSPWRSLVLPCSSAAQAGEVLARVAALGLLTDVLDPAVGVISCIGSAGCWQTELDTLAEAERFVANRPAELAPGALVHVSGCDKLCATRAPVSLTLLGRSDQSGFDTLMSAQP